MTPAWLLDIVAAVMLVVVALSAARLVAARPWQRDGVVMDTDVAHLLMAVAMAGMLTTRLRTLPDAAWAVIFGLLAAWFAVRVTRDARRNGTSALAGGHCAPHLVHSASMLYMVLAMTAAAPAAGGTGGMGMAGTSAMPLRYPTLALLFAFVLVGYSVWDLDQLSGRRYAFGTTRVSLASAAAAAVPVPSLPVPSLSAYGLSALAAAQPEASGQPDAAAAPTSSGGTSGDQAAGGMSTFLLSPAITVGCRIAMGVAMAFMLFIAI